MSIKIETKDEFSKECVKKLIDRGYTVYKADIDDGCFSAKCKSPKGQKVVMRMPVSMMCN